MSDWNDLGLPCPLVGGYSYSRLAGLARTPFPTAAPEQRQVITTWSKRMTLSWGLSIEQLQVAENYLLANGYSWWEIDMQGIDGEGNTIMTPWLIRLTSDYQIATLAGGVYQLSASAEAKQVPVACVLATCDDTPSPLCP